MSIFLLSPHPVEKPSKNSGDAAARPIDLHRLRVLEQADRGRKLWVLDRRGQSRQSLSVRHVRRHLKNLAGQMIDPAEQAATARDEDSRADIIDERFLFDCPLEQLESLSQSQMDDSVQCLALDFLSGKTGIVLEQDCFARQTIAQHAAALVDF